MTQLKWSADEKVYKNLEQSDLVRKYPSTRADAHYQKNSQHIEEMMRKKKLFDTLHVNIIVTKSVISPNDGGKFTTEPIITIIITIE